MNRSRRRKTGLGGLILGLVIGGSILLAASLEVFSAEPERIMKTWHDGERERKVWMAVDELAIFYSTGKVPQGVDQKRVLLGKYIPEATIEEHAGRFTFVKANQLTVMTNMQSIRANMQTDENIRYLSRVFYLGQKGDSSRMVLGGEIVVGFGRPQSENEVLDWCAKYGLRMIRQSGFHPNTYLVDATGADDLLELASTVRKSGETAFAYPNWYRTYELE